MNQIKKDYFLPEKDYQRYIIGNFKNTGFVSSMLNEYSELCINNPKLNSYYQVGDWTVIPCPINLVNRGCFFDLMNWLSQNGEEAFAIAINADKNYFSRTDAHNPFGDTVLVKFDDGVILKWYLPKGLVDNMSYSVVDEFTSILSPSNCKEFLSFIGANVLIEHFNL